MRISTISTPLRPVISSPDRSGATSATFFGTSASQPTRQAEGASMRHSGGIRLVRGGVPVEIGASADFWARSQLPLPIATASHRARHTF